MRRQRPASKGSKASNNVEYTHILCKSGARIAPRRRKVDWRGKRIVQGSHRDVNGHLDKGGGHPVTLYRSRPGQKSCSRMKVWKGKPVRRGGTPGEFGHPDRVFHIRSPDVLSFELSSRPPCRRNHEVTPSSYFNFNFSFIVRVHAKT